MTANLTITDTELEAIRSVELWIGTEMQKTLADPAEPPPRDAEVLTQLLARLAPAPPIEEVARGPSVVGRDSKEIETRWAKEAIGLTAVELNEAYAQLEITRNGRTIPSDKLSKAFRRLEEVMQRLGLVEEIPF